jgi:hypothetical protein
MEFNWEDFKNSDGKIAVHCKTEEEAEEFIKECFKHGIKWSYSDENTTHWGEANKRTYYVYSGRHLYYYYENLVSKPNEVTVVEYKEDNKMELKEGMIIECRNGNKYLLRKRSDKLICSNFDGWFTATYDEKLNENEYYVEELDIMKIYESKAYLLGNLFDNKYLTCIWERKESKKMTLAQISEALGYEVEVIDNE